MFDGQVKSCIRLGLGLHCEHLFTISLDTFNMLMLCNSAAPGFQKCVGTLCYFCSCITTHTEQTFKAQKL